MGSENVAEVVKSSTRAVFPVGLAERTTSPPSVDCKLLLTASDIVPWTFLEMKPNLVLPFPQIASALEFLPLLRWWRKTGQQEGHVLSILSSPWEQKVEFSKAPHNKQCFIFDARLGVPMQLCIPGNRVTWMRARKDVAARVGGSFVTSRGSVFPSAQRLTFKRGLQKSKNDRDAVLRGRVMSHDPKEPSIGLVLPLEQRGPQRLLRIFTALPGEEITFSRARRSTGILQQVDYFSWIFENWLILINFQGFIPPFAPPCGGKMRAFSRMWCMHINAHAIRRWASEFETAGDILLLLYLIHGPEQVFVLADVAWYASPARCDPKNGIKPFDWKGIRLVPCTADILLTF